MSSYIIFGILMGFKGIGVAFIAWICMIVYFGVVKRKDILNERHFFIIEMCFFAYVVTLLQATGLIGKSWNLCESISFNLIPFINEDIRLMFLNTLLFVPLGIFFPLVFKKLQNWKWCLFACIAISFLIEIIQMLFIGRLFDIDDLIMNTIGAMMGFIVEKYIRKLLSYYQIQCDGTSLISVIVGIVSILLGVTFDKLSIGDILLYSLGVDIWVISSYRLSELITIMGGIAGIVIGMKSRKQSLAKAGLIVSTIAIIVALMNLKF